MLRIDENDAARREGVILILGLIRLNNRPPEAISRPEYAQIVVAIAEEDQICQG